VYPAGMRTDFFGKAKPKGYENFMDPNHVAGKIIENLKKEKPEEELIVES
jgi:short-subunit dehydrogenase